MARCRFDRRENALYSRPPPGWPTVASEVVDLLGDGDGTF
jgi:hypothetical protein